MQKLNQNYTNILIHQQLKTEPKRVATLTGSTKCRNTEEID